MKFITDINLGKLAKWLRILGYDTIFYTGNVDRNFLRRAEGEGRVALTKKKAKVGKPSSGSIVVIKSDNVYDQLTEIMNILSFLPEPERMFSICVRCNEELMKVEKEKISGMVPDYIFASHIEFHMCPRCKGVFWPGTHVEKAHRYLTMHIQSYHP